VKYADLCKKVSDQIADAIEAGTANGKWELPWYSLGQAKNARTGATYKGMNWLLLSHLPWWATYNQWQDLGLQVKKGETATPGMFWGPITRKNKATGAYEDVLDDNGRRRVAGRGFSVFSYEQVEPRSDEKWVASGKVPWTPPPAEAAGAEVLDHAEALIEALAPRVEHHGDRAYYAPVIDVIVLPPRDQFHSTEGYYATKFHEVGHWTGHESRLARKYGWAGSDDYAFEELVAELTAAMVCAAVGISPEPRPDHAVYVKGWLSKLRSDPTALPRAAGLATKAANFILTGGEVPSKEKEEVAA